MSPRLWAALGCGALFGTGLALSGMTDARRIQGFLDVTGQFDPRLLFVLGGAVLTSTLLFRFVLRRPAPLLEMRFQLPTATAIDLPLLAGAAVFGLGWGLAGYCPGPALAGLGVAAGEAAWFVPAMLAGMALHRAGSGRRPPPPPGAQ